MCLCLCPPSAHRVVITVNGNDAVGNKISQLTSHNKNMIHEGAHFEVTRFETNLHNLRHTVETNVVIHEGAPFEVL